MRGPLVLDVPVRLELERRVLDVEVAGKAVLQLVEQPRQLTVPEARVVDDDVRGEHRQPRGHPRCVQVVHVVDVGHGADVLAYLREVEVAWCCLQQYVDGLAQQSPGAREDQAADDERGDRVGPLPAR